MNRPLDFHCYHPSAGSSGWEFYYWEHRIHMLQPLPWVLDGTGGL